MDYNMIKSKSQENIVYQILKKYIIYSNCSIKINNNYSVNTL